MTTREWLIIRKQSYAMYLFYIFSCVFCGIWTCICICICICVFICIWLCICICKTIIFILSDGVPGQWKPPLGAEVNAVRRWNYIRRIINQLLPTANFTFSPWEYSWAKTYSSETQHFDCSSRSVLHWRRNWLVRFFYTEEGGFFLLWEFLKLVNNNITEKN